MAISFSAALSKNDDDGCMCTSRKGYFWREKRRNFECMILSNASIGEELKGENERENRKYIGTYALDIHSYYYI